MVEFEYIWSRGTHGVHSHGQFDALVGSEREIWIGDDGSGLIREGRGPTEFFTEEGRARWEAAGSPPLDHDPSVDLFAPGCLSGIRAQQAQLAADQAGLHAMFVDHPRPLREVERLLGETTADGESCRAVYNIASQLTSVEVVLELADQLGRVGTGLAGVMGVRQVELVFAADCTELLGYRHTLAEPAEFAPAGTTISWCGFLKRAIVDRLPSGIPPIPLNGTDDPAGGSRRFQIRPGFTVSTGYTSDPLERLAALRDQGVISEAEYQMAKDHPSVADTPRGG